MEHCPKCWQKEQESTLITDDETGEDYCPECGFVSADPEKKMNQNFKKKMIFVALMKKLASRKASMHQKTLVIIVGVV